MKVNNNKLNMRKFQNISFCTQNTLSWYSYHAFFSFFYYALAIIETLSKKKKNEKKRIKYS